MNHRPNSTRAGQTAGLMAAVIGAASEQRPAERVNAPCLPGFDPGKDTLCAPCTCVTGNPPVTPDHDTIAADAQANSYQSGVPVPPGVYTQAALTSVVGANERRILVADMPEGVYVGGVLISDPGDLANLAGILAGLALRRA